MSVKKDIKGKTYGYLTAIRPMGTDKHGHTLWEFECACTKHIVKPIGSVTSGNTTSCGCRKLELLSARSRGDITGQKSGSLVAIEYAYSDKNGQAIWRFKCEHCNTYSYHRLNDFTQGKITSCGCINLEKATARIVEIGRSQSLDKNPNWQGGKSFEVYGQDFTYINKEATRAEFQRQCFLCGTPENGEHLSVHHITYNKKHNHWLPLCRSCHTKTNFDRWYWFNKLNSYWVYKYMEDSNVNFR